VLHWGAKKLRKGSWSSIIPSCRCRRLRCPLYTQPFAAVSAANDVWCTDFKGWFRTGDGRQPDRFTLTDAHTSLPAQQERFDAFRAVYNHERPHEALGQHADDVTVRRMPSNGRIKWAG